MLPLLLACTPEPGPESCPPPPPQDGEVRVRRLACAADLPVGPAVAARIGDWVLENATARFVVRDGAEGHAMVGLRGGSVVDALLVDGGDRVRELAVTAGLHQIVPERFEAGPAHLRVTGPYAPFRTVHDALPLDGPTGTGAITYRLAPDRPVLEIRSDVDVDDPTATIGFVDLPLFAGSVRMFAPGHGTDLPNTADATLLARVPVGTDPGDAVATGSSTRRTVLSTGAVEVLLYEPASTVVRTLALGRDPAEALAHVRRAHGLPVAPFEQPHGLAEIRDASGAPLAWCATPVCEVDPAAAEAVPLYPIPDALPLYAPPARVSVHADGAFRLTARGEGTVHRWGEGDTELDLPPGAWDITVQAGPTRRIHALSAELASGGTLELTPDLSEVVAPDGWYAADLHVHTENSPDSDAPLARRLLQARAEGLDLLVLSEHDHASPAPADAVPATVTGAEITTLDRGHFNVWPLDPDPDRAGRGAPDWHGRPLGDVLAGVTGLWQCNHPRLETGFVAAFDVPGFSADDCPLVEVLNGYADDDTPVVLQDWTASLDRGFRPVATGASDSHDPDEILGRPRTWIRADAGDPATLAEALRDGRAVASEGPLLDLALTDGTSTVGIGGTLVVTGPVTAHVTLRAPEWMVLGDLVLYADGAVIDTLDVRDSPAVDGAVSVSWEVPVVPDRWVAAVHHTPWAVTNPVFVD